jgi:cation transport regulator
MPYDSKEELPESIRDSLPARAQESYREACNSAWEQYVDPEDHHGEQSREKTAHRVAWSVFKSAYEKEKEPGHWQEKHTKG